MEPVVIVVVLFFVALLAIEGFYISHHEMTISEHMQRINARMGLQVSAGIFFLLGCLAGWFIAHFTSPPPGG
jgi:uncharacterized membrane protein YbjE (DUF340 family)